MRWSGLAQSDLDEGSIVVVVGLFGKVVHIDSSSSDCVVCLSVRPSVCQVTVYRGNRGASASTACTTMPRCPLDQDHWRTCPL